MDPPDRTKCEAVAGGLKFWRLYGNAQTYAISALETLWSQTKSLIPHNKLTSIQETPTTKHNRQFLLPFHHASSGEDY
jgi:hypothetical protein